MDDASTKPQDALEMIDRIYGDGFSANFVDTDEPFVEDVRDHLFGEIWTRPGLSVRDRRLLSLGVVAAYGQGDLFALHAGGALKSGDIDPDQLQEIILHLSYYAGGTNATMIRRGALEAIAAQEAD